MAFPKDRLTDRAIQILSVAEGTAQSSNLEEVHSEHVLYALATGERGTARMALETIGVDLAKSAPDIPLPAARPDRNVRLAQLPLNAEVTHALAYAKEEGVLLDLHYIGTEHLLLGLLRLADSPASQFMLGRNITIELARQAIKSLLAGETNSE